MSLATPNLQVCFAGIQASGLNRMAASLRLMVLLGLAFLPGLGGLARGADDFGAVADRNFQQARKQYQNAPHDTEAAWKFGRACFDLADLATNDTQRADIANLGIAACEQALARDSNSAPTHYYLGMDLAELAETKTLGALKLVTRMQTEFEIVLRLEQGFDYAGADRNLGLLYRDAPSIGSIGDRRKSRQHFQHAIDLAPQDPENWLNLIESDLKWGRHDPARSELTALEGMLPAARTNLTGEAWAPSWVDWEQRLTEVRKKIPEKSGENSARKQQ
jgi:tetratricopeptide (TPR) repeat protein